MIVLSEASFELDCKADRRCGKNIKIIDYQHWHLSDLLQQAADRFLFYIFCASVEFGSLSDPIIKIIVRYRHLDQHFF